MGSFILFAPNIGGGGGVVLFQQLVRAGWADTRLVAILERCGRTWVVEDRVPHRVDQMDSTFSSRLGAEGLLKVDGLSIKPGD